MHLDIIYSHIFFSPFCQILKRTPYSCLATEASFASGKSGSEDLLSLTYASFYGKPKKKEKALSSLSMQVASLASEGAVLTSVELLSNYTNINGR